MDHIIGNEPIKTSLKRAWETKSFPNTLLFAGPEGVGKSLFAKAIASLLLDNTDKVEKGNHPDLYQYFPEGKIQTHNIESMRSFIAEVGKAPFQSSCKVFVIHDADRMLPAAANALLKTLEEPTLDSYIILLTSRPSDLLSTIVSRARVFRFSHVSEEAITTLLIQKHQKSMEQAQWIAKMAHGSVAKAIEIIEQSEPDEKRQVILDLLRQTIPYYSLRQQLERLDGLYEKSKDRKEIELLYGLIEMWFRDLHLLRVGGDPKSLFFAEHSQKADIPHLLPMQKVLKATEESKQGFDRSLKLSTCLEKLFFDLSLVCY